MKKYRWILLGVILLVVLAGANAAYRDLSGKYLKESEESRKESSVGTENTDTVSAAEEDTEEKAADFAVYDEAGNEIRLSDYTGTPVVVNFWASWCPPCKREMPAFQKMREKYGENVKFLMVNETDGDRETMDTAKAFVEENGYEMDLLFDLDGDAANTYYLMYLPRTLFIDADGNLVDDHVGEMTESELEGNVEQLISGGYKEN